MTVAPSLFVFQEFVPREKRTTNEENGEGREQREVGKGTEHVINNGEKRINLFVSRPCLLCPPCLEQGTKRSLSAITALLIEAGPAPECGILGWVPVPH